MKSSHLLALAFFANLFSLLTIAASGETTLFNICFGGLHVVVLSVLSLVFLSSVK